MTDQAEALLRELDALKPVFRGNGPGGDGGKTFSGWEVSDWLMQRIRAALTPPASTSGGHDGATPRDCPECERLHNV